MKSHIFLTKVKLSLTKQLLPLIHCPLNLTRRSYEFCLCHHHSLNSPALKRYFLFPLPFAKSERETGLTKWLCGPGNRSTEAPERIWAVPRVPSAAFSADADSKEEEDLVKVLVAEDPLAPLESDWYIDWKNQVITSQPGLEFSSRNVN